MPMVLPMPFASGIVLCLCVYGTWNERISAPDLTMRDDRDGTPRIRLFHMRGNPE